MGWLSWFIDNKHKLSLSFTIRCLLMVSFCLFALVFIKLGKCQHCIMFACLHGVARRLKQCLFVCFLFSPTRRLLWAGVKERCRETFPIYKFSPFSEYAISFEAKSFVFLLCYALTTLRAYLLQNFAKNVLCFYCHFCWFFVNFCFI